MNPKQRLSKLVKTQITKIEKSFHDSDRPLHPKFEAMGVLQALHGSLLSSQKEITRGFRTHTVLAQLVSNELSEIARVVDYGCFVKADTLLNDLKSKGSTFKSPPICAKALEVA